MQFIVIQIFLYDISSYVQFKSGFFASSYIKLKISWNCFAGGIVMLNYLLKMQHFLLRQHNFCFLNFCCE